MNFRVLFLSEDEFEKKYHINNEKIIRMYSCLFENNKVKEN